MYFFSFNLVASYPRIRLLPHYYPFLETLIFVLWIWENILISLSILAVLLVDSKLCCGGGCILSIFWPKCPKKEAQKECKCKIYFILERLRCSWGTSGSFLSSQVQFNTSKKDLYTLNTFHIKRRLQSRSNSFLLQHPKEGKQNWGKEILCGEKKRREKRTRFVLLVFVFSLILSFSLFFFF